MNQPVPFDLAVGEDRAFRFEHGPGTSAYLAPDPGAPGQARVVTEGPAPIVVDSITGLVGEPGDSVVQIRVMPPNPGAEIGYRTAGRRPHRRWPDVGMASNSEQPRTTGYGRVAWGLDLRDRVRPRCAMTYGVSR